MAGEEGKSSDFYAVLGLKKECSTSELRNAYKKLALKWHPDRCSASGNPKFIEEAKKKFQDIQEAYSVLSDESKRFMYDVGVYHDDDDEDDDDDGDKNGMEEFLGEMAAMMNQTKPCEDVHQSFEDLQRLFEDMFQKDIEAFNTSFQSPSLNTNIGVSSSSSSSSYNDNINDNNKRNCSSLGSEKPKVDFDMESLNLGNFSFGMEGDSKNSTGVNKSSGRRTGRKQKVSSQTDVSSSSHGSKISV